MYSRNHSTAIVFILCVAYLILSDNSWIINNDFVLFRLISWKGYGNVVLMGRVSVTISYSFRCLTTETVIYVYKLNSFIEILAVSKYSMWHREANTFNNKCSLHFACSEVNWPVVRKYKQVCDRTIAQKRNNRNHFDVLFFMRQTDMNKFFEKHLWPMKLSMLYVCWQCFH